MHAHSIETPLDRQRKKSGHRKKGKNKEPRAPRSLYKRVERFFENFRSEHPDDWWDMIPRGANEAHGSRLGEFFLDNKIDIPEANAGRYYAILAAQYDRYFGIQRRTAKSPTYERFFGRDDEVERRRRDGSIGAYERRARKIKKKWFAVQDKLPPEIRNVLDRVCIENLHPAFEEFKLLKMGLLILAEPMNSYVARMRAHHQPGAKMSARKRSGKATWTARKKTAS